MLDRMQLGDVPRKHHVQLRGGEGELRYEECFTRDGFEGRVHESVQTGVGVLVRTPKGRQ